MKIAGQNRGYNEKAGSRGTGFQYYLKKELQLSLFYYLIIDKYATAIFANNYLLPRSDIKLALGRYLVETSTAGIPLNRYYGKAVAGI
jgi:hypothetical protein